MVISSKQEKKDQPLLMVDDIIKKQVISMMACYSL